MKKIGILVGEDADLPINLVKNSDIITFPFVLDWENYKSPADFYKSMRELKNKTPKTSQPSAKTFERLIKKALAKYQDILVITVSSKFSGTYNSARQAKKTFSPSDQKRIRIFDSETSSGAEALITLHAHKLINSVSKINLIIKELEKFKLKTRLIGAFEDPRWLESGGRISKIQALIVKNMLKAGFRPVLTIKDGQIVTKKIQANAKNKVNALFGQFKNDNGSTEPAEAVITHADCEEDAIKLKEMIENYKPNVTIRFMNFISPVVGSHLGPGTLLLSWSN